ncbi:MAG: branched chain amino acid aminotransferase, partial [Oscillospiraceae bacterium]|nr:branched chain amino acid aminotransferase [Oscillospiraceae bacterium]
MQIQVNLTDTPNAKPADETQLGFGRLFTDHMFIMEFDRDAGWHSPQIKPYSDLTLSPSAMVLHYSQTIFEGMKAYRTSEDKILL